jgi:pyruvate dehydrogenase E1 component alpha subunit
VAESFNMAALWKLPVLYIIENNQYAMGTSIARSTADVQLYKRGAAYDIPGEQVDGMDVVAVHDAGKKAIAYVRSGKGPFLLEAKTYRYRGHSMSDPAKYRTREEVQEVREKRDPIDHFGQRLVQMGLANDEDLKALDKDVRAVIQHATEFATESAEPAPEELYTDILH